VFYLGLAGIILNAFELLYLALIMLILFKILIVLIEKVGRFNFSNEIVSDKYLAIYESF